MTLSEKARLKLIMAKTLGQASDYQRYIDFTNQHWDTKKDNPTYLQMVVSAHLFVEQSINEIIKAIFPKPEKILRYNFSKKLEIVSATGLIPQKNMGHIVKFNQLRNSFAHNLNYEVKYKDLKDIQPFLIEKEWKANEYESMRKTIAGACGIIHAAESHIKILREEDEIKL